MYYQGGKRRVGKQLVETINTNSAPRRVIEPFIGGGGFLLRLLESGYDGEIIAGDFDEDITTLFKALSMGWLPPKQIPSKEEWERVLTAEDFASTALRSFTYFASLYNGRAKKPKYNALVFLKGKRTVWEIQWEQAKKLSEAMLNSDASITFIGGDYKGYEEFLTTRTAVYCDPPYANTAGYRTGDFDNDAFWEVASKWAEHPGVSVYVSEYNAPEDWKSVWQKKITRNMGSFGSRIEEKKYAIEQLFVLAA